MERRYETGTTETQQQSEPRGTEGVQAYEAMDHAFEEPTTAGDAGVELSLIHI